MLPEIQKRKSKDKQDWQNFIYIFSWSHISLLSGQKLFLEPCFEIEWKLHKNSAKKGN